jgi:hypothetical protein
MMPHLGSWISALADGQLDAAATERALAHVAACRQCADELDAARAARHALLRSADVAPAPDLAERLLALSATIPPSDGDPLRKPVRAARWEVPAEWQTTLTGDLAARRRRRRTQRLVAAGAGGVGVLGCALFALGQAPVVTPDPSRSAALTLLAHVGDGRDVLATPAGTTTSGDGTAERATAWLTDNGWVAPEALPPGYELTGLRIVGTAGDAVELDVEGPDGALVVHQERGRLADVADAPEGSGVDVAGRDVAVLSREPWRVAWQAGDVVVDVAADVPQEVLTEVVAAFPGHGYDAGVLPRISRGWSTVTGVLSRP